METISPLKDFIRRIPKAELHLHIEGTLEPELMFQLAARNGIPLRFPSVDAVRDAYQFQSLQSFLDIYYEGAQVLQTEQDFYDLTWAYLERMAAEEVRHVEIFFDPQTHTERGISFETAVTGIHRALEDGHRDLHISNRLIMCFLRHLSPESAMATLEQSLPFKPWITAVGLDSSEKDRPPALFKAVFDRARAEGFQTVAHAGEEGPAAYIWEALDLLRASRIDHGIRCMEDPALVKRLAQEQVPLTVCPLSNIKLCVFPALPQHNLKKLMEAGLCVTINSDDPAYFGGYITENFLACRQAFNLTAQDILQLCRNAFLASFLSEAEKQVYLQELNSFADSFL